MKRFFISIVFISILGWNINFSKGADNVKEIIYINQHAKRVSIAGDWNDWSGSASGKFSPYLEEMRSLGKGTFSYPVKSLSPGRHEYKFIIDGNWEPGPNRVVFINEKHEIYCPYGPIYMVTFNDINKVLLWLKMPLKSVPSIKCSFSPELKIKGYKLASPPPYDLRGTALTECSQVLEIITEEINPCLHYHIKIEGLSKEPITRKVIPFGIFQKRFISDKPLGVNIEEGKLVFRLFAPRAIQASLLIFDTPDNRSFIKMHEMEKHEDGVWECVVEDYGQKYYKFRVIGMKDQGEGFSSSAWDYNLLLSDLYAKANIYHDGVSIIIRDLKKAEFFKVPNVSDLVIYELHVRDMTSMVSSKVLPSLRGKYLGLVETESLSTGIGHLKELGINAVELMPVQEFDNIGNEYHWGYMPSLYFAPESSYATSPDGKQVEEFKKLVDTFHKNGIAVIMDVVYNHTGEPHYFTYYDKFYYYRVNEEMAYLNFSGCGRDVKTENPMVRRLIIDSLKHFVINYGIDGFRFDLAELIDRETLLEIEKELKKIKPDIILILEPWSFRGNIKGIFKGHSFSLWNDDFRNRVKHFVKSGEGRDGLIDVISGSTNLWAGSPVETINYVESHDDFTLIDELSFDKGNDGTDPSSVAIKMDKICAAILFTSLGIPMIAQGQEFLRSKGGCSNSYNKGDIVNGIKWELKEKNKNVFEFYKNLIRLRLSEHGKCFRYTGKIDSNYILWILPQSSSGIGYIINADWRVADVCYMVLINASKTEKLIFNIPDLKVKSWTLIGDCDRIDERGLASLIKKDKINIELEPLSLKIYKGVK